MKKIPKYAYSSHYRNSILPNRLYFMKKLREECEGINIAKLCMSKFNIQIQEMENEIMRLQKDPYATPRNPLEIIKPLPENILNYKLKLGQ